MGGGRPEGSPAVDGGQAAVSLADVDGIGSDSLLGPIDACCIFESSQFEGSSVGNYYTDI